MKPFFQSLKDSLHAFTRPGTLVLAAMFIALNVVLTRYLSIQTQFLRIGFGFLPVAIFSMLCGPIPGAIAAVIGDVLGFLLFPGGIFSPGLTASAFILGLLYGLFLYKKEITLLRLMIACFVSIFIVDLCLNTIWLSILYGESIRLMIVGRIIKSAAMLPVQVTLLYLFQKVLGKRLSAQLRLQNA